MDQDTLNNLVRNYSNIGEHWIDITRTDISSDGASDSFTSVAYNFELAGLKVGHWVNVSGFTNPSNNGDFLVTSVNGNNFGVSAALASEIAGDSVTVNSKQGVLNEVIMRENNKGGLTVQSEINALASRQHSLPLVS